MDQYAYSQNRESIMSHLVVVPSDLAIAKDEAAFMRQCIRKNDQLI